MKTISILGSTGSIGRSTMQVIAESQEKFQLLALTAQNNVGLLIQQALEFKPLKVVIGNESYYPQLKEALSHTDIEVSAGYQAIAQAAVMPAEVTVSAVVGAAGLYPTFQALKQGGTVALANKESLVAAGSLMIEHAKLYGAKIIPIDSEHNAIFQVFEENNRNNIESIILTASGGPFWQQSLCDLQHITPEIAVKHPKWNMGAKISIDSATLMNKGLEVIEAHYLFNMPEEKIEVLIHPQSIVHSLVRYCDGSVLAQLSEPDMKTPISYAIGYPSRIKTMVKHLSLGEIGSLTFHNLDEQRFKAISLARQSIRNHQEIIFNAANELAVAAFMQKQISFLKIIQIVEQALENITPQKCSTLEDLLKFDQEIRQRCLRFL